VTLTGRRVLRRAVRGQARLVVGASVLLMSWQACESLVPVAIGAVIDRAIRTGDSAAIGRWIALLAGLFLVLSLSFRFGSRLSRKAAEQAAHEARVDVAGAVLDPRSEPDGARRTGGVLSIATSDTTRVGAIDLTLPMTCAALVSLVVAAVALLLISVPLGLLVLLGAPPLLAVTQLLGRPLERRAEAEQAHAAQAASVATDVVTGLRVLKGISGEGPALDRYRTASRDALQATLRAARAESAYQGAAVTLTLCFLALVALVAGRFATEGRISVGDLVAAVGLAQFLLGPLTRLAFVGATVARARASATRVAAVLDTPRREPGDVILPDDARGSLSIPLPDGTSLDVAAGELLGVAADATDAAAFVEGLDRAAVDGRPVAEIEPDAAVRALLVAGHDAYLFHASVRDNLNVPGASDPSIERALVAADADQVLAGLPDGADTLLAERGRSLSGGQRQRVALARALGAEAMVLVLHDPTTAVDSVTEARIATGLARLRADRTTVVVTTSPALLAACDRVVLIEHGRVRAEGSHQHLAETDAGYRELVLA